MPNVERARNHEGVLIRKQAAPTSRTMRRRRALAYLAVVAIPVAIAVATGGNFLYDAERTDAARREVAERDLWVVMDDNGRTTARGTPWGTSRCGPLDITLVGLPAGARRAVADVADELEAMGLPPASVRVAAQPPLRTTDLKDGPQLVVLGSARALTSGRLAEVSVKWVEAPSRIVLTDVTELWSTGSITPVDDPAGSEDVYRRLARAAVAHGYGLFERPTPEAGSAIVQRPELAPDRWSDDDRLDLLAQSGCEPDGA